MRIALIDHYDSFTYNVLDWLASGPEGLEVACVAYDDARSMAVLAAEPVPLVLSPGPKRPEDAEPTVALVRRLLGRVPIFGVCLGHQILAHVSGATIVRSRDPHHGTTRTITPRAPVAPLFAGMPPSFAAATYNSLVVDPATLAPGWRQTAVCDRGECQGLAYEPAGSAPAYGVQFHPESYLSEHAALLRRALASVLGRAEA
jgi:anthranilate synthase/aminodeoxychorismate synthase-like glutamine amidotransferase